MTPDPTTKPPRIDGQGFTTEWNRKGLGWDCREVYYIGKQRRRRHLGHIGRSKWIELQEQFQSEALTQQLTEWVKLQRIIKTETLRKEEA